MSRLSISDSSRKVRKRAIPSCPRCDSSDEIHRFAVVGATVPTYHCADCGIVFERKSARRTRVHVLMKWATVSALLDELGQEIEDAPDGAFTDEEGAWLRHVAARVHGEMSSSARPRFPAVLHTERRGTRG